MFLAITNLCAKEKETSLRERKQTWLSIELDFQKKNAFIFLFRYRCWYVKPFLFCFLLRWQKIKRNNTFLRAERERFCHFMLCRSCLLIKSFAYLSVCNQLEYLLGLTNFTVAIIAMDAWNSLWSWNELSCLLIWF